MLFCLVMLLIVSSVHGFHAEETAAFHCDTCLVLGSADLGVESDKALVTLACIQQAIDLVDYRRLALSLLSPCSRGPPALLI